MDQCLFILLLFTGTLPLALPVPHKYYLIQQAETWSDAQAYCRATYTDLATINNNDDMVSLQDEAKSQKFTSSAWIGLYTNFNSWHWSFGNVPLGSYVPWLSGQPENAGGNEQCGCIRYNVWGDMDCTAVTPFVCLDDTKTGNYRFIFISVPMSWSDAQSYCRLHYTDLTSVSNSTENSVVGAMNPGTWTWFGLTRDPWRWSDQTTNVSFIKWSPGNADDYLQNKSCGYLTNIVANEAQCSNTMPFYCYLSTKQRIMRVKVKSSQDVNDPAVMTAILEKVKQTLKDNGTGNITVKWREQADGAVLREEKMRSLNLT